MKTERLIAIIGILASIILGIGIPLIIGAVLGGIVTKSWILFTVLSCIGGGLAGFAIYILNDVVGFVNSIRQ